MMAGAPADMPWNSKTAKTYAYNSAPFEVTILFQSHANARAWPAEYASYREEMAGGKNPLCSFYADE